MLQSTLHVNGDEFSIYRTAGGNPTFLFHHGAGLSAHSFALVAPLLQGSVIAYDCRGHGSTKTANNNLSLEQLSDDLVNITNLLEYENIVLVGHSLGACVIVHAVARGLIRNVTGVVVIDVVEGTAVESLKQMKFILDRRPKSFDSIPDAVNWSISSNQLRNRTSAEISIPKLLVKNGDKFVWICNLMETEPYWEGWFENLSTNFLSMKCGKLLILAGTERLDKPLMIAQMQGKFQLIVLKDSGHLVQEDQPEKLAHALMEFWNHNKPLQNIKRFPLS